EEGSYPPSSRPRSASSPRPRRRLFTFDDLQDEFGVGPGSPRPGGVIEDALAVARRFADVDVARDHGAEYCIVEKPAHLVGHLTPQVEPRVEHGEHDPANFEPMVLSSTRLPRQIDDLRKSLHREILALDRDEYLGRSTKCRPGELAERGRA